MAGMSCLVLAVLAVATAAATTAAARGGGGGGVLGKPISALRPDVVVAKPAGRGEVTTVGEALKRLAQQRSVKGDHDSHFIIYIKQGIYEEHIVIDAPKVVLIGDGMEKTIITGRLSNKTLHDLHQSATLTATENAHGFMARDMGIYNTAGDADDFQAVALFSDSNQSVFYRCDIRGFQDTLLANQHLQFYRDCRIWGTVDFVCGNAAALFQNCDIFPRRPADPRRHDVITAQGREDHGGSSGFVFQNCTITTSPAPREGLTGIQTFLGRPWKHHARVVFMACSIDSVVHADGYVSWNKSSQGATPTTPSGHDSHIYYGEYKNHGDGANVAHRVDWDGFHVIQSDDEARQFTARHFIHGQDWLPGTGVDYYLGLN